MARKKISEMTEHVGTPAAGDLFTMVDVSDLGMAATGTNKKIRFDALAPAPPTYPSLRAESALFSSELIYLETGKWTSLGSETWTVAPSATWVPSPFFATSNVGGLFNVVTDYTYDTYGVVQWEDAVGGLYAVSLSFTPIALGFTPIPDAEIDVQIYLHSNPNYEFNQFNYLRDASTDGPSPIVGVNYSWTGKISAATDTDWALDIYVRNETDVRDLGLYYSIDIVRLDA